MKRAAGSRASAKRAAKKSPKAAGRRLVHRREGGEVLRFSEELPLLPLRDVVIFPGMMVPLLVGRAPSVAAVVFACVAFW